MAGDPCLYEWSSVAIHCFFVWGGQEVLLQPACIGFGSRLGMILSLDTVPRRSAGTKDDELVQTPQLA